MTEPTTERTAVYLRGETVFACPPSGSGDAVRLRDFVGRVTTMARSPSVFAPLACIAGAMPSVAEAAAAPRRAGTWRVLALDGTLHEDLADDVFVARYVPSAADPFMFFARDVAPVGPVGAALRGVDGCFETAGGPVEGQLQFFRGLLRADGDGRPFMPADLPLWAQAVSLLRGREPWAADHLFHLTLLWHLLRRPVSEDGEDAAWADMKATAELLRWPRSVGSASDPEAAFSNALISATVALMTVLDRPGSRPALPPPLSLGRPEDEDRDEDYGA